MTSKRSSKHWEGLRWSEADFDAFEEATRQIPKFDPKARTLPVHFMGPELRQKGTILAP